MTDSDNTRDARATKTNQRQLTVKSSYYAYQLYQQRHQRSNVSEIRLKGIWLAQAGFEAGQEITVQVMDGCLIVTKKE